MKIRLLGVLQDALLDCLPKCMLCCRLASNEVGLKMGRNKLAQETNIIKLIQSRRYLNAAIKLLLAKDKRERLKEQTKYLMLSISKLDVSGVKDEDDSSISNQSSQAKRDDIESDPERHSIQEFSNDNIVDVTATSQQMRSVAPESKKVSYAYGQNLIPLKTSKQDRNRFLGNFLSNHSINHKSGQSIAITAAKPKQFSPKNGQSKNQRDNKM